MPTCDKYDPHENVVLSCSVLSRSLYCVDRVLRLILRWLPYIMQHDCRCLYRLLHLVHSHRFIVVYRFNTISVRCCIVFSLIFMAVLHVLHGCVAPSVHLALCTAFIRCSSAEFVAGSICEVKRLLCVQLEHGDVAELTRIQPVSEDGCRVSTALSRLHRTAENVWSRVVSRDVNPRTPSTCTEW